MSDESSKGCRAPSKASITIDVQNNNHTIRDGIVDIFDKSRGLPASDAPTEIASKCLLDTVVFMLQRQNSVTEKIPNLSHPIVPHIH